MAAYIIGRLGFDRTIEAPLLDESDLGTVIDLCQLIGRLISSPWSTEIPPSTPDATETAFQALRRDAVCLVETLRRWVRTNVPEELHARGYTIVFGWANRKRQVLEDDQLSDLLKKAFRKALALEARASSQPLRSDDFLKEEIGLTALAERIGVNRKGLAAVADALGFLPERDWYRSPVKFDPTEADAIEFHCRQMVTRMEVATALGMASQDVQPLVDAGFIREFRNVTANGPGGFRFLRSDLETILGTLAARAQKNSDATSIAFFTYAKNNGVRMGHLATSILQGRNEIAPGAPGKPGFRSIGVVCEPGQSLPATSRAATRIIKRPAELLSLVESETELNITRETLIRLTEEGHLGTRGSGACTWLDKASVLDFATHHRNAREFLPYFGGSLDELIEIMADNDIDPLLARRPKRESHSVNIIYRYSDLAAVFKLRHDPTRFDDPVFNAFWSKVRELGGTLPPYLQFPSKLPVSGQLISNGKRKFAFFVTFDPTAGILAFEGKRQASEFKRIEMPIADESQSLARLEQVLSALADKSPKRH
ncbi:MULTISPECIES: hypothetical protein [unclassified Ensifer]|uniref:hypothetical protein n=1 Tax=unclassified Ensifer TaxID=2633371 RepID=UPI001146A1E4|nr:MULTISPECIES: hypothetical protein [unclassified Ensifer]